MAALVQPEPEEMPLSQLAVARLEHPGDDEALHERGSESPRAAPSSNTEMPEVSPRSPTSFGDDNQEEDQEPATGGSEPAAAAPPLSPGASTVVDTMELGAPQVTCVSLSPSASPEGLPTISELEQGGTPGQVRAVHDSIDSILLRIMDYNRSIHMINYG